MSTLARISALRSCLRCKGSMVEKTGEPCTRCRGSGIDPSCYEGCVQDGDEEAGRD